MTALTRTLLVVVGLLMVLIFTMGMYNNSEEKQVTITPTPNPFPTPSAPRQGVAAAHFGTFRDRIPEMGSWAYVWSAFNGTYPSTYELVPMLVWEQNLPSAATVQSIAAKKDHDYWLVFNECENEGQCNRSPEAQAQFYHNSVLPLITQRSLKF